MRLTLAGGCALAAIVVTSLAAGVAPSPAQDRPPTTKLVRMPLPKYDGTLTPYTFEIGYPLVMLSYDTLLWRDAQGIPRPWLARSVKRSEGGRRLTIRLRKGVRWQDGRRLSADDVAFTFEFVARRFHPRFTPELADVERARATGRLTVTIDLRRRSLGFDDQPLADLPILPRHLWEDLPAGRLAPRGLPVGSGPYRLVRARRGGYRFRANRDYFKGRPLVKRIEVPIIRQEERTYSSLRRRKVDMLPISLPKEAATDLGGAFGINLTTGPSYTGTALLFNLRRSPFDRRAARRAVARSLDLGRMVRNVGPGVAADRGYIHPESRWSPRRVLQRFDERAARRALERLDLPPIRVLAPDNDPVRKEAGRQVMLALERAGAEATLTELSSERLSQAIGENGAVPDFEAAIVTTPALASYDPDFLAKIFGSGSRSSPLNLSGYRSSTFARLADRVASAPNRRARRRAVGVELRLLANDLPEVPLFFSRGAFAYRPVRYDGWVFVKGAGILDKRSFLPGEAGSRGAEGSRIEEGPTDSGRSVLDILATASLVVLAIVILVAVAAIILRRRLVERS